MGAGVPFFLFFLVDGRETRSSGRLRGPPMVDGDWHTVRFADGVFSNNVS